MVSPLANMLLDAGLDFDPSYNVYRALFPNREIPPREREFLKKVYTLDVSRLSGRAVQFPAYGELMALLKDECTAPGEMLINNNATRGQAKELLARWLNVQNRNGTPYTEADDRAGDTSLRIGMCREDGVLSVRIGPVDNDKTCVICVLDGPLGGFFYFDPKEKLFSR